MWLLKVHLWYIISEEQWEIWWYCLSIYVDTENGWRKIPFVFSLSFCICQPWCSVDIQPWQFWLINHSFHAAEWQVDSQENQNKSVHELPPGWVSVLKCFLLFFVIFLPISCGYQSQMVGQYMSSSSVFSAPIPSRHQQYNFTFVFTMVYNRIRG